MALAAVVLVLTVDYQLFDTNFHTLWEATALFAGDHPYRDFFDWGLPLQAAVSVVGQLATGHRLIGEFAANWLFILASIAIAFRMALRVSQSIAASLATMLLAVLILAATPVYHYPKLFVYTTAVWLAWRYMDRPGVARAAALGLMGAIAFLFRHDHGVYMVPLAFFAIVSTRVFDPVRRSFRALIEELAVCGVVAAIVVAPWAVVVGRSEGLPQYIEARTAAFRDQSGKGLVYRDLARISPARALRPDPRFRTYRPLREESEAWLYQMTILVPLLVLITYGLQLCRGPKRAERQASYMIVAALFLGILASPALRQPSYFVVLTPITAALAARLVSGRPRPVAHAAPTMSARIERLVWICARGVAAVMLLITAVAALRYTHDSDLLRPREAVRRLRRAIPELLAQPAIDGYFSRREAVAVDRPTFARGDAGDKLPFMLRYVHDCTGPEDRILVTGSTPFQVGYYTERRIAGGHLYWHQRWRSDASREAESLALLERHRPAFAVSTTDPVLEDFKVYPRIRRYLAANYAELPGSNGLLLVDIARRPTATYGHVEFPCFR